MTDADLTRHAQEFVDRVIQVNRAHGGVVRLTPDQKRGAVAAAAAPFRDLRRNHGDVEDDSAGSEQPEDEPEVSKPAADKPRRFGVSTPTVAYAIPLPRNSGSVQIEANFPLSESDWEYFMTLLTAMKPGLTAGAPTGEPLTDGLPGQ